MLFVIVLRLLEDSSRKLFENSNIKKFLRKFDETLTLIEINIWWAHEKGERDVRRQEGNSVFLRNKCLDGVSTKEGQNWEGLQLVSLITS